MAKDYRRYRRSRMQKIEDKNNLRQAVIYLFLTLGTIVIIIFLGIPSLAKLAAFFGDIRSTGSPIDPSGQNTIVQTPEIYDLVEATNSTKIKISGYGPAKSNIRLSINGRNLNTESDLQGNFSFGSVLLSQGENKISATAEQNNLNSNPSKTIIVNLDQTAPELIIDSPVDNQSFFDLEKQVDIIGATEAGNSLSINGHYVIVENNGNFRYTGSLNEGENKFEFTASDPAGNQSKKELTVRYTP